MIQRSSLETGLYAKLAEEIRKEILETLRKKGISVRRLEIELKPDSLNVSLNI